MEREIEKFINYLTDVKKSSQNTVQSYRRDLVKMMNFMKDNGILDELEALGINEGDTVRIYGFSFEYFK